MTWHNINRALHLESRDAVSEVDPVAALDSVSDLESREPLPVTDSDNGQISFEPTPTIKKRSPKYVSPVNTGSGGDSGDTGGGGGGGSGSSSGSGSTSTSSCGGGNCQYPVSGTSNQTLPIVLGVV